MPLLARSASTWWRTLMSSWPAIPLRTRLSSLWNRFFLSQVIYFNSKHLLDLDWKPFLLLFPAVQGTGYNSSRLWGTTTACHYFHFSFVHFCFHFHFSCFHFHNFNLYDILHLGNLQCPGRVPTACHHVHFHFFVFTVFVFTFTFLVFMTSSIQATCNALVESQLPAIIDGLVNNNLNPQEICTQIAACPWWKNFE